MTGEIKVIRETGLDPRFPLSRHELMEFAAIVMDALGYSDASFSIKLVNDREIARLNEEFMGCVGPTNVLSFPAEGSLEEEHPDVVNPDAETSESRFLGELALSVDALSREADLYGQPPVGHLARLLAHGVLHLAGYDHSDAMYELTDTAVDRVMLEYADRGEGQ